MPITVSYPIHFIGRSWTIFLFADLIFDPFLQLYSFCLLVLTSDSFRLSVYLCIYMCLSMSVCYTLWSRSNLHDSGFIDGITGAEAPKGASDGSSGGSEFDVF